MLANHVKYLKLKKFFLHLSDFDNNISKRNLRKLLNNLYLQEKLYYKISCYK